MPLDELKEILDIKDDSLDDKLELILEHATARLKVLLGGLDVPKELNYILIDVSAIRFNRIGSEGLSTHTVDGESMSFSTNDFSAYKDDIQSYLDGVKDSSKGKLVFL